MLTIPQFASARLLGPLPPDLPEGLVAAGIAATVTGAASILIMAGPDSVATAREFADAVPHGQEALIVILLSTQPPDHAAAAQLWGFTRQAALDWAPRQIRVNAIALGADPLLPHQPERDTSQADPRHIPTADIAATIRLMWKLPSMTGQFLRLGPP